MRATSLLATGIERPSAASRASPFLKFHSSTHTALLAHLSIREDVETASVLEWNDFLGSVDSGMSREDGGGGESESYDGKFRFYICSFFDCPNSTIASEYLPTPKLHRLP